VTTEQLNNLTLLRLAAINAQRALGDLIEALRVVVNENGGQS
jgi:hypothetical protein